MAGRDHQLLHLRPNYRSGSSAQKVIEAAREEVGRAHYDNAYRLNNGSYYCTELIYEKMAEHAPEVEVEPWKLGRLVLVSPDDFLDSPETRVLSSSDSNFWLNCLSTVN